MRHFVYKAFDTDGHKVHGRLRASNRTNAAAALINDRLQPLTIRTALFTHDLTRTSLTLGKKNQVDIRLIERLRDLIQADVPVVDALSIIVKSNGPTRQRAVEILSAMRDGSPPSVAFSVMEPSIGEHGVALIAIGESTGRLGEQLIELSKQIEERARLRSSFIGQMIYPALLFVLTICTIFFLAYVILPEFGSIFDGTVAPPPETEFILAAGSLVRNFGIWILGVSALLTISIALLYPQARHRIDPLMLRIPIIGNHWRKIEGARFCSGLATLLRGGASLSEGMQTVISSISTPILKVRYMQAISDIKQGDRVSHAFQQHDILPSEIIEVISMGENSGQLAEGLMRAASIINHQTTATLTRVTALAGPILTALMGLLIAGVIGAILMGVMSINEIAA